MKINFFKNFKKVVIKIGSSLLISNDKFNKKWFETFIEDILFLRKKNILILELIVLIKMDRVIHC